MNRKKIVFNRILYFFFYLDFIFLIFYLFIFYREGREGERQGDKH